MLIIDCKMSGMDRSDWDSIRISAICDVVGSVTKVSLSGEKRKKCCIYTDNIIYHPAKYQMTGIEINETRKHDPPSIIGG